MCTQLIKASGIKIIIYSTTHGTIIKKKPHELTGMHISKGIKNMLKKDEEFIRKEIYKVTKILSI